MTTLEHTGIWGRSQSGKSTRAKILLRSERRVVVFDLLGEYGRERGFVRATTRPAVLKAIKQGWRSGFRVAYKPPRNADLPLELHKLSVMLQHVQAPVEEHFERTGEMGPTLTFVVEEMADSFPNQKMRAGERAFEELCRRGRHAGIRLIGISQRMADVSTVFRGNTLQDFVFPLRSTVDIDTALALIGREHRGTVSALQTHEFIHYAHGQVSRGRNKIGHR